MNNYQLSAWIVFSSGFIGMTFFILSALMCNEGVLSSMKYEEATIESILGMMSLIPLSIVFGYLIAKTI